MNLQSIGDKAVEELKQKFKEANLNDTGKASDSLQAVVGENSIIIEGLARVLFLQYGRRSGPDEWRELMPFILPWVRRKLKPPKEGEYPIAVTIAKKIAKEGTRILRDPSKGLQIEITLGKVYDEMSEIVGQEYLEQVTNGLVKKWKS